MTSLLESWNAPGVQEAPVLRPHQDAAINRIETAYGEGKRAPILQLATGAGKTVVAGELIRREVAAGRSCLFLAPRRELIYQASGSLSRAGVEHRLYKMLYSRSLAISPDPYDAWV